MASNRADESAPTPPGGAGAGVVGTGGFAFSGHDR